MNKKIESIKARLSTLTEQQRTERLPIEEALQKEYAKAFDADKRLQKDLKSMERGTDQWTEAPEGIYEFHRCTFEAPDDDDAKDALDVYISEHGFSWDRENHCLLSFTGEFIGIDEEGDVFESDGMNRSKEIASASDYTSTKERNALIEAHMERTGFYPNVFSFGHYGLVGRVNVARRAK